ncbi:MAG: rubrerythrin family protein [Planctomycetes bacterium]|nr:rubrerythrin family protein [Planctomycetota bacterium]
MTTDQNLKDAFAGESQANRKYLAFAKKAEQDKLPNVAKLFRAAAEAETVHAHAHLRVMGGIKSTAENLQVGIDGESYEFKSMYPAFIAEAEAEGNKAALATFKNAMAVEKIHHDMYVRALAAVKAGKDLPGCPIYVCAVCGNTVAGAAPDKCAICGVGKDRFFEVK